jgi:hypothetical protein
MSADQTCAYLVLVVGEHGRDCGIQDVEEVRQPSVIALGRKLDCLKGGTASTGKTVRTTLAPRASVNLQESRPVRGKRAHQENEADMLCAPLPKLDPRTRALAALPEG